MADYGFSKTIDVPYEAAVEKEGIQHEKGPYMQNGC
jgi:hypothetical protein